MANWKIRFEELACEIEGLESPADVREREYKAVLLDQIVDEANQLIRANINRDLAMPVTAADLRQMKEDVYNFHKIDFHEDV